jgi:hypothetical protein
MLERTHLPILAALAFAVHSAVVQGADAPKPRAEVVELFAGMESGDLDVKIIPKDATKGTVILENKTDKPVTVKLPEAFAAVPVLAQFGGCPGGGLGGGCPGGGGGNQGLGGGMMGGGMMGGMGGGGGFFNVGAERTAKIKVVTVCLEHGKKDPSPHVEYKLVKLESFAQNATAREVVKMLARGEIDQHSAQAAVWNLENGLSWQELAQKIGVKHLNGTVEPYFSPIHLQRALAGARLAESRAEKAALSKSENPSPGDSRGNE